MEISLTLRWSALGLASLFLAAVASAQTETEERLSELLTRGQQGGDAVRLADGIFLANGLGNSYKVVTSEGSVVIDTGVAHQAAEQKRQLEAAPGGPVTMVILTHAHGDHTGGALSWREDGARVVAHRQFRLRTADQRRLSQFRGRRSQILWGGLPEGDSPEVPHIEPDVIVDDRYSFELGGLHFDVISTPGGEGPDALSVFIRERKALFTGDALGPTQASFPNLFTLRGENLREAVPMIESIERLLPLQAELLLPGHFEPVRGADAIRDLLTRVRDAVAYVHDATVAGMNEGRSLFELMQTVKLPPELQVSQQYGRVPWGVRAIWESYTGWFRYESTTELYAVPASSVHPELVEMAGGADVVAARATERVQRGEFLEALHLVDIASAAERDNRAVLEARLAALSGMAKQIGRRNFQEAGWLRHRIENTRARLTSLDSAAE